MPTNDLYGDEDEWEECDCEYPHGHGFEPPFEMCTCEPDCFHVVSLNLEDIFHESQSTG